MNRRERRLLKKALEVERKILPPNAISAEELSAFAALHDTMKEQGYVWRMTFHPLGAVYVEVHCPAALDMPEQDIKVEADSIREAVPKLSEAIIAAAMKGAAEA